MARVKPIEEFFLPIDKKARKKYAPKTHKTTAHFDSNLIAVYTHWKAYIYRKHKITEQQLKVLAQLNNQTTKQNAHCIAYNIHLPVQAVNRALLALYDLNLVNIHTTPTKPTEKNPNGRIYRFSTINNNGKQIFAQLAAFHRQFIQL